MALAFAAVLLASCSTAPTRATFTAVEQTTAVVPGMPNVRIWADAPPSALASLTSAAASTDTGGAIKVLSLSGGAENGAYGAGVLVGWSKAGTRPEFRIVSGISTGALIAPLAFLGPSYDEQLRAMYTQYSADDLFRRRTLAGGLLGTSLADTAPLQKLIASVVDQDMLQKIAVEHRKGRRLIVVTTNLDAQRPVAWNMGEIALQGGPQALALFRSVLLASASIPGVFPPVYIEVEANGRRFKEMHVDGGTTTQIFTLPDAFMFGRAPDGVPIARLELYLLFNNPLGADFAVVKPRTLQIMSRSLSTLIRANGRSALLSAHNFARQQEIPLHLTYIGADFTARSEILFDSAYMRQLFDYGHQRARDGSAWSHAQPDLLEQLQAPR